MAARAKSKNKSRYLTAYAYATKAKLVEGTLRARAKQGTIEIEEKPLYIEQDGQYIQYDVVKVIDTEKHPIKKAI